MQSKKAVILVVPDVYTKNALTADPDSYIYATNFLVQCVQQELSLDGLWTQRPRYELIN